MLKTWLTCALLLLASSAFAQQQQTSPAEYTLQAVQMVTQLGQVAQSQQKRIEALESQVSTLRKELDEAKKEPKK